MKVIFARYGIPQKGISDNGQQYWNEEQNKKLKIKSDRSFVSYKMNWND